MPVFLALALFFAGFNFLEAGLPARLSILADGESRGATLGVFSSSQFLGAFVGGLIGGRFLAPAIRRRIFRLCAAGRYLAGLVEPIPAIKAESGVVNRPSGSTIGDPHRPQQAVR